MIGSDWKVMPYACFRMEIGVLPLVQRMENEAA